MSTSIETSSILLVTGNLTVRSFNQQSLEMQLLGEIIDSTVSITDPKVPELHDVNAVITHAPTEG